MRGATLVGLVFLFLAVILAVTAHSYNGQWILALVLVAAGAFVLFNDRIK
jgi:hypothetical protein